MRLTRFSGILGALLFASDAIAAEERYADFGALFGATRAASEQTDEFSFDSKAGLAVGFVWGYQPHSIFRTELEVAYTQAEWNVDGVGLTADGINVNTNFIFSIGSSFTRLEFGAGAGWMFLNEACFEEEGFRLCADGSEDDWTVQGIAGISQVVTENSRVILRYQMKNIGGFSSEDRMHVLTAGLRYTF